MSPKVEKQVYFWIHVLLGGLAASGLLPAEWAAFAAYVAGNMNGKVMFTKPGDVKAPAVK